ncbi:MAG: hypothetical protein ACKO2T_18745, partial [Microcystis aeruginosa]
GQAITQPNAKEGIAKQYTLPPPNCILSYIFINIYIPLRQVSLARLRAIAFYLLVVNNAVNKS